MDDLEPGNAVAVTSSLFKGKKLGIIIHKCKGVQGWEVQLVNPDSPTKVYCISEERGDTIIKITK